MTYPFIAGLAWFLLGLAFAVPAREFWRAWRDRPLVIWDPYQGRYRSARLLARLEGRRPT